MSSDAGKAVLAVLAARENIRLILEWTADRDFEALKGDTPIRYAVERAFIAIGASLKDIPSRLLQEHGIPSKIIAGFAISSPTRTMMFSTTG